MKIGILTLPIAENYGGTLQAIALYRLLEKEYNVVLIYKDFHPNFLKEFLKKIIINIPFIDIKGLKLRDVQEKERLSRKEFHKEFINNEISNISKVLYTKEELSKFTEDEKLDAVIVGSDQVWRKRYINDKYYKSYFLDFVDNPQTLKIAYAASFGTNCWEGTDDIQDITKYLESFTAISTREKSGVNICKTTFNIDNVEHVLDPTLLISKDFYISEIISKYDTSKIKDGGLLTYVLDEANLKKEIINLARKNTKITQITHLKGFNKSQNIFSVPEWLDSFYKSDFIVTDSFHGMIFSIIFEKNFIIIGNHNRGIDRFESFLGLLGLEHKLISTLDEINDDTFTNIDYSKVNHILEDSRNKSLDFLYKNLERN